MSPRPVEVWQDSHEWELLPTILSQYLCLADNRAGGLWSSDLSIIAKVVCLHYSHNTWFHKKHHSMPSYFSLTLSWEAKHWKKHSCLVLCLWELTWVIPGICPCLTRSRAEFLCVKKAKGSMSSAAVTQEPMLLFFNYTEEIALPSPQDGAVHKQSPALTLLYLSDSLAPSVFPKTIWWASS